METEQGLVLGVLHVPKVHGICSKICVQTSSSLSYFSARNFSILALRLFKLLLTKTLYFSTILFDVTIHMNSYLPAMFFRWTLQKEFLDFIGHLK